MVKTTTELIRKPIDKTQKSSSLLASCQSLISDGKRNAERLQFIVDGTVYTVDEVCLSLRTPHSCDCSFNLWFNVQSVGFVLFCHLTKFPSFVVFLLFLGHRRGRSVPFDPLVFVSALGLQDLPVEVRLFVRMFHSSVFGVRGQFDERLVNRGVDCRTMFGDLQTVANSDEHSQQTSGDGHCRRDRRLVSRQCAFSSAGILRPKVSEGVTSLA